MLTTGNGHAPGCQHQAGERTLRAMTIKERIKIHKQIEAENKRKLKEWRDRK